MDSRYLSYWIHFTYLIEISTLNNSQGEMDNAH